MIGWLFKVSLHNAPRYIWLVYQSAIFVLLFSVLFHFSPLTKFISFSFSFCFISIFFFSYSSFLPSSFHHIVNCKYSTLSMNCDVSILTIKLFENQKFHEQSDYKNINLQVLQLLLLKATHKLFATLAKSIQSKPKQYNTFTMAMFRFL